MLDNVVLLIALVALIGCPWPPLNRKQIEALGHVYLACYATVLILVVASHHVFFTAEADYSLAVLILLLAATLLRRQWQYLLLHNTEMATLCGICIMLLGVAESIIMWVASDQVVASVLLWPTAVWELYAIRRNTAKKQKHDADLQTGGDDLEAQRRPYFAKRMGTAAVKHKNQKQQQPPAQPLRFNLSKKKSTTTDTGV